VHSGPEAARHGFDARVTERDLRDTYLPQFEACVREAKVQSIMPAYNRVNGKACTASVPLLQKILRQEWGFDGYVVTDCGAIDDIYKGHGLAETPEKAAAMALKAGTDLNCGETYRELARAERLGLVSGAEIDRAVKRLYTTRFRLGMIDPPAQVPYAQIPISVNDSPAHRQLAKEAAQKAMVLLENRAGVLPLRAAVRRIAVIGPTADNLDVLMGNYSGKAAQPVTILEGIRRKARARRVTVSHVQGSAITGRFVPQLAAALSAARRADAVVLVMGNSPRQEGEEGENRENPGGDRTDIGLPPVQETLLKAVVAIGKPTVLVLTGGSALAVSWAKGRVGAILMAWYPGQDGGTAVADVLFGDYNPGGRLPITFYASTADLPPFADYNITGRTYRYFRGVPLFPFGHGLSYTTFRYHNLTVAPGTGATDATFRVDVEVENAGQQAGDEVVQLYLSDPVASAAVPLRSLVGFERVALSPGQRRQVRFELTPRRMSFVDDKGRRKVEPGSLMIAVGGGQPDRSGRYPSARQGLTAKLDLTGKVHEIE
jgi:beta-glucosidase